MATATEVSTIGIVYAFIVGFLIYGLLIYRNFDWRRIVPMLIETACLSGAILLIIGCATGMAWALTQSGFSRQLVAVMSAVPAANQPTPTATETDPKTLGWMQGFPPRLPGSIDPRSSSTRRHSAAVRVAATSASMGRGW